jgi:hypothetical protein
MLAGAAAALMWAAAEPAARRFFRTPYSDLGLLVGLTGPRVPRALAVHVANGAVFGALLARFGGGGVRRAVLAAEAENLTLWPAMAVVERVHPRCRDGTWPPLFLNTRVFAYEAVMHALFGVVLGSLLRQEPGE